MGNATSTPGGGIYISKPGGQSGRMIPFPSQPYPVKPYSPSPIVRLPGPDGSQCSEYSHCTSKICIGGVCGPRYAKPIDIVQLPPHDPNNPIQLQPSGPIEIVQLPPVPSKEHLCEKCKMMAIEACKGVKPGEGRIINCRKAARERMPELCSSCKVPMPKVVTSEDFSVMGMSTSDNSFWLVVIAILVAFVAYKYGCRK